MDFGPFIEISGKKLRKLRCGKVVKILIVFNKLDFCKADFICNFFEFAEHVF